MDVSFLTPLGALFALAAVVPLGALALSLRRAADVRRTLSLQPPRPRALVPVVAALVLLPVLVGVAAAQPVVIRQEPRTQRADAQVFVVFDTSRSMAARPAPQAPSRLARAKREARQLAEALGDIPVGIASMTDRTLPNMLPTTDLGLIRRTITESIAIDRPPPSRRYPDRATTLQALVPIGDSHFFTSDVKHRVLVVFTDGESSQLPADFNFVAHREQLVPPFFVHVWSPGERVFVKGQPDARYTADPTSTAALERFAQLSGGRVFDEHQIGAVAAAVRAAAGHAHSRTTVNEYSRHALAPWFVLAGTVPLAFLLWRRNL
jgi:hypothetical protein